MNLIDLKANLNLCSTCRMTFRFDSKGITVNEKTADYNSGCGFGHGVVASGRFRRVASRKPKLKDPLSGEPLE